MDGGRNMKKLALFFAVVLLFCQCDFPSFDDSRIPTLIDKVAMLETQAVKADSMRRAELNRMRDSVLVVLRAEKDAQFQEAYGVMTELHQDFEMLRIEFHAIDSTIQNKYDRELLDIRGEQAALKIIFNMTDSSLNALKSRVESNDSSALKIKMLKLDDNRKGILSWEPSIDYDDDGNLTTGVSYEVSLAWGEMPKFHASDSLVIQTWPYAATADTIFFPEKTDSCYQVRVQTFDAAGNKSAISSWDTLIK
jgi:hypothetical protein